MGIELHREPDAVRRHTTNVNVNTSATVTKGENQLVENMDKTLTAVDKVADNVPKNTS